MAAGLGSPARGAHRPARRRGSWPLPCGALSSDPFPAPAAGGSGAATGARRPHARHPEAQAWKQRHMGGAAGAGRWTLRSRNPPPAVPGCGRAVEHPVLISRPGVRRGLSRPVQPGWSGVPACVTVHWRVRVAGEFMNPAGFAGRSLAWGWRSNGRTSGSGAWTLAALSPRAPPMARGAARQVAGGPGRAGRGRGQWRDRAVGGFSYPAGFARRGLAWRAFTRGRRAGRVVASVRPACRGPACGVALRRRAGPADLQAGRAASPGRVLRLRASVRMRSTRWSVGSLGRLLTSWHSKASATRKPTRLRANQRS